MGKDGHRRARFFDRCPVGIAYTDEVVAMLSAYNVNREFHRWPPGRDDPRLLEAFVVIKREHELIDAESIKQ